MIDTTKFPKGQFARDICLLKNYHATAGKLAARVSNLRLEKEEYYNASSSLRGQ